MTRNLFFLLLIHAASLFAAQAVREIFPTRDGESRGFITADGAAVPVESNLQILDARVSHEGLALVNTPDGFGYMDVSGKLVIPAKFEYGANFSEGLALVITRQDDLAYIDRKGEPVITGDFDNGYEFKNGLAPIAKKGKWGYVDRSGRMVADFQYARALNFLDGRGFVKAESDWKVLNEKGETVIDFAKVEWGSSRSFYEGLAAVKQDDAYGYMDTYGKIVIPFTFSDAHNFSSGLGLVTKPDGVQAFIDKEGNEKIVCGRPSSERRSFRQDEQITLEQSYDVNMCFAFSGGLARVVRNRFTGYIDPQGKAVIQPQFIVGTDFHNGLALVRTKEDQFAYINTTGKIVWKQKGLAKEIVNDPWGIWRIDE